MPLKSLNLLDCASRIALWVSLINGFSLILVGLTPVHGLPEFEWEASEERASLLLISCFLDNSFSLSLDSAAMCRAPLLCMESMRGVSRTGRWGQTRQASLPLGSFLKESGVEGDEDAVVGSKRSSRRRFRCCASRAQLSPPNTLIPASSPSLPRPPGGDLVDWWWFGPRPLPGLDRE